MDEKKSVQLSEHISHIHSLVGDMMMGMLTASADKEFIIVRLEGIRARVDHILRELGAE